MSVNEIISRHLFYPVHERLRGRSTLGQWRRLRKNDRLDMAQFEAWRLDKLRRLLAHCRESVPYYRQLLLDIGLDDVRDFHLADLDKLPVLDRDVLRTQGEDMQARGYQHKLISYSTGGSTGEPLVFYTDKHRESCLNAQKLRARSWFGVHPGDRQVDFWGSPIEMNRQNRIRQLKDRWLLNQVVLSASHLTEQRIAGYVRFLHQFRPRLIYGYPTVIYRVASYITSHPGVLGSYRPRLIVCTSEMLLPHLREEIIRAFACPVANEYGSRDGGMIAYECPQGSLHILGEQVIVEVDKPDDDGVGDLLITNLDGYGMPFIRYRIGDRGALDTTSCTCGLPLPRLRELQGRANDFLVGRNGRLVHSSTANYVLRGIPALKQYQLRQRRDHSFDLYLIPSRALTETEKKTISDGLNNILDEIVPVNFHVTDTIEPEKSGKYRWVISEAQA